jgi:hypothetical protein
MKGAKLSRKEKLEKRSGQDNRFLFPESRKKQLGYGKTVPVGK